MNIYTLSTRLMSMSDEVWLRHANPWSVWTRIPMLFVIVPIAYSWKWLGWTMLAPLSVALLWTYLNPRIFPPPKRFDSWASKGVLGEKLFVERKAKGHALPRRHLRVAHLLTAGATLFSILLITGIVLLNPWVTATGTCGAWLCKMWFVDRMVWLYEDVQRQSGDSGATED